MAVPIPGVPSGTRVKVRRAGYPIDPSLVGRTGIVVAASEYRPNRCVVALDVTGETHEFAPAELEVTDHFELPADRRAASARRALP